MSKKKSKNEKQINNDIINNNSEENNILLTDSPTNVFQDSEKVDIYINQDIISLKDFKPKEVMYYNMLSKFFNECTIEQIQSMIDIINGNHLISLRFLDWFVTRFCYLYKLSINVNNKYIKESNFNVNISYKAQLKSFKKKYFDPFRRKKKFYYCYEKNNLSILTTIGQLNFFRWSISNDIIKYTEENYRDIIKMYNHVNSYFKKNLIDTNSFSTSSTSDEPIDSTKSNDNGDNKNNDNSEQNKNIENISKSKYKSPVIARNIFLEF